MIGKKIFSSMIAAIFFVASFTVQAAAVPEVKIGILVGVSQVNLQTSEPCTMIDADTKKEIQKISKDTPFTINFSSLKNNSVEIRGGENFQISINGKKYFGGVLLKKNSNSLTVINIVPLENYLRGVVPKEMSPTFQPEALKAQAVAARSFTLKNKNRHEKEGYELCAKNHCQFYDGVAPISAATDKAISETRGEVLYFDGEVAMTNFHTDSGGMTESIANVWGAEIPYLQPVAELTKNTRAWNVTIGKLEFAKKMGAGFGELQSINLSKLVVGKSSTDRTSSGRVKSVQLVGTNKTVTLTGNEMRSKFSLPSTLFGMKIQDSQVVFEGYGSGHGVGMSQHGADAFAKSGWTYDKILKHYYKGTEIKKLY